MPCICNGEFKCATWICLYKIERKKILNYPSDRAENFNKIIVYVRSRLWLHCIHKATLSQTLANTLQLIVNINILFSVFVCKCVFQLSHLAYSYPTATHPHPQLKLGSLSERASERVYMCYLNTHRLIFLPFLFCPTVLFEGKNWSTLLNYKFMKDGMKQRNYFSFIRFRRRFSDLSKPISGFLDLFAVCVFIFSAWSAVPPPLLPPTISTKA